MRSSALEFLACPRCRTALELVRGIPEADGHVIDGALRCAACGRHYPIVRGVPTLLAGEVAAVKKQTAQRFTEEWSRWSGRRDYYLEQFLGWLAPLTADAFRGGVIFEAGCGKGRHTELVAKFGARAIVALDLGESAYLAFNATRALGNAHVMLGDLHAPPVLRAFDLAFSVGVLHHLPDPKAGFEALCSVVVPGGRVAIWVYGRENNEWIVRFIDPIRKALTSRMRASWLKVITLPPSVALWSLINLVDRAAEDGRASSLPYGEYFAAMRGFPIDEIHSIVFDQLVTPVAHYLSGDEVRRWFSAGFDEVIVRWHGRYSWSGHARVLAR